MLLATNWFNPIRVLHTSQMMLPLALFTQRTIAFSQNPSSRKREQSSGFEVSCLILTLLPIGISVSGKGICMMLPYCLVHFEHVPKI